MLKNEIHPPGSGPNSNPVLYGVAAGLAELFPPVMGRSVSPAEAQAQTEQEPDRERGERD